MEEGPKQAEAFHQVIVTLTMKDGLDNKKKQLIYIGIKASPGDAGAVVTHVSMTI